MFKCLRCIYLESNHRKFFLRAWGPWGMNMKTSYPSHLLGGNIISKTILGSEMWTEGISATKKNLVAFHYSTGWLIRILIMAYYNPYITGQYNPLYTLNNQCFFIAHNDFFSGLPYKTLQVLLKVTCVHANFVQFVEEGGFASASYSQ